MAPQPILVTGATGNVGSVITELLVDLGAPVRAAAFSTDEVTGRFGDAVEPCALDFTDASTWPGAFRGVERMFLMRPPHLSQPRKQMIPALETARRMGLRHIVFLSLQGAQTNRAIPHASLERWLRKSGMIWTFVRASFFMQNLTTTHRDDIVRGELIVPAGNGRTAFVDARDVAAVATAALLNPLRHRNRAWTPTGPDALTYDEVCECLSEVLDRRITYAHPGAVRYARHAYSELDMPWPMVAVTTAIYTAARLGQAAGLTDDVMQVLGRPPVGFGEFAYRERNAWAD